MKMHPAVPDSRLQRQQGVPAMSRHLAVALASALLSGCAVCAQQTAYAPDAPRPDAAPSDKSRKATTAVAAPPEDACAALVASGDADAAAQALAGAVVFSRSGRPVARVEDAQLGRDGALLVSLAHGAEGTGVRTFTTRLSDFACSRAADGRYALVTAQDLKPLPGLEPTDAPPPVVIRDKN
jgi:hypothetical protein